MSSTGDAPAELAGDPVRDGLVDSLRSVLGEALVDSYLQPGHDVWVRIRTDAWREAGISTLLIQTRQQEALGVMAELLL